MKTRRSDGAPVMACLRTCTPLAKGNKPHTSQTDGPLSVPKVDKETAPAKHQREARDARWNALRGRHPLPLNQPHRHYVNGRGLRMRAQALEPVLCTRWD